MKFGQYDVVRLKSIRLSVPTLADAFNLRQPAVGDVACSIEVYLDPLGYELECCDANGITQSMMAFAPDDIELERVG